MSLGLKNARATYNEKITIFFHHMIHHEMEVCVDDMIAESQEGEDH